MTDGGTVVDAPEGAFVRVRVVPRSGRSKLDGVRRGALLVRLAAAPVDGAANDELIELVARTLKVRASAVSIVQGARARDKRLHVAGLSAAAVAGRLGLGPPPSGA